jgi:hypothetical protein
VGAGVGVELVAADAAGAGCAAAGGWSAGAAPATGCVGAFAVVLPASLVTCASANATAAPASSRTMPTIAAGSRQLGGRW